MKRSLFALAALPLFALLLPAQAPDKTSFEPPAGADALAHFLKLLGPPDKTKQLDRQGAGKSRYFMTYKEPNVLIVLKDAGKGRWAVYQYCSADVPREIGKEEAEKRFAALPAMRAATTEAALNAKREAEIVRLEAEKRAKAEAEKEKLFPGRHDMAVKAFTAEAPKRYVALTMDCSITDFYPGAAHGLKVNHYCFLMIEPKTSERIYGVAEKTSSIGKDFFDLLKDGEYHRVTVRVHYLFLFGGVEANRDRVVVVHEVLKQAR